MIELIPMLGVLFFLTFLYVGFTFIKKKVEINCELSRKIIHITLGLVTLSFPWIFHSTVTVWVMCGISIFSLLLLRHNKFKNNLGQALHGVDRSSLGEIFFPLSVALLFQLTHQEPIFYFIPILVLTLADASAAIVGVKYGQSHYDAAEGIKSVEGSLVFFITSFLCVQIPLLLFTDIGNAQIILVSLFIAVLITICEAGSWQGLDNFFIPLGCYILLINYLTYDVQTLLFLIGCLIFISAIGLYFRQKSTMNLSALFTAIILIFLFVTLEPRSFIIPLLILPMYSFMIRKEFQELKNHHNFLFVLYINLGGLIWLFLKNIGYVNLTYEFIIYYAIQMAVITWIHRSTFYNQEGFLYPIINGIILFIVSYMVMFSSVNLFDNPHYIYELLNGFLCLILSLVAFKKWAQNYDELPTNRLRLIIQGGIPFLGSVLYFFIRILYA